MRNVAADELGVAGLPSEAHGMAEDARAFREKNINTSQYLDPANATAIPSSKSQQEVDQQEQDYHKLTPRNLKKLLAQKYEQEEVQRQNLSANGPSGTLGDNEDGAEELGIANQSQSPGGSANPGITEFVSSFTYAGKRIAVPVRVEPKVNFALERTVLVSQAGPC